MPVNTDVEICRLPPKLDSENLFKYTGWLKPGIRWLAGDGSDRRYFRLHHPEMQGETSPNRTTSSYVLMLLPHNAKRSLAENCHDWMTLSEQFRLFHIKVPKIVGTMNADNALIIEDFGDELLELVIRNLSLSGHERTISAHYQKAFEVIKALIALPINETFLWATRRFDEEKFIFELQHFRQKYLEAVLGVYLEGANRLQFDEEVFSLASYLTSLPYYCVHRDFHSRNLILHQGELGVIDFQDARLGPAAYDLVSLCFDAYVPLSTEQRLSLLQEGITQISSIQSKPDLGSELTASWKAVLLQRQLKAIGSYGYLSVEKKRGNYLQYVPFALQTLKLCDDKRWPLLSDEIVNKHLIAGTGQVQLGKARR